MNEDRLLLPGADGLTLVASTFGPADGFPVLLAPGERSALAWAGPDTERLPSISEGMAKVHGPRPALMMCTISAGISLQLRRVSSAIRR